MIRKAKIDEVPEIRRMLAEFSREGDVLPRTLASLYSHLRDYYVWREDDGPIQGIVALHVTWDGLGEIRSLVVVPERQRQGLGTALVTRCLEEARELGLRRVFALTTTPEFFGRFGFRPIAKEALPPIVWADCVECVKFPDCDELPVMLELEP